MIGAKHYFGAGVVTVIVVLLLSATFSFAAETITNTYDELDRLTKAEFGSRFRIEYSYDAYGNRSQKTITMLDSSTPDTTIVSKPGSFSTASVTFTIHLRGKFHLRVPDGRRCMDGMQQRHKIL